MTTTPPATITIPFAPIDEVDLVRDVKRELEGTRAHPSTIEEIVSATLDRLRRRAATS